MRILFLSGWFPYPPDNGSKVRIFHLLRALAGRHPVTLLTFYGPDDRQEGLAVLETWCQKVRAIPWRPFSPYRWRALLGFLSPKPRSLVDTFSPAMQQAIREEIAQGYDLVIASQVTTASYWREFRHLPAILEELEIGSLYDAYRCSRGLRRLRLGLTWAKLRRYVAGLLPHFRACTVVSEAEFRWVRAIAPQYPALTIVPNCVDVQEYASVSAERRWGQLIFPGALTYSANYEALIYFLREIYPRILEEEPGVSLVVTGSHRGIRWPPFPLPGPVRRTGWVPDIRPLVAGSWVTVVPLRRGGGTRFKILESLALGTPVVSTPKGAEGLDVIHGRHLLLAESAPEFAQAVLRLLRDRPLWEHLSREGGALVAERYDWPKVMPAFLSLVEAAAR